MLSISWAELLWASFPSLCGGRSELIQQRYGNVKVSIGPGIAHTNKLRISSASDGMRFEFLEPAQFLQPNLTSAETRGVIPLLKKKLVLMHIFFCKERRFAPCEKKNALFVKKKKVF